MTTTVRPLLEGLWDAYVSDVRRRADESMEDNRAATTRRRRRQRAAWVLSVTALSLILIQLGKHGAEPGWLTTALGWVGAEGLARDLEDAMLRSDQQRLYQLVWWSAVQIAGYVVLPVLVVKVVLKERLRDYGVRISGVGGWQVYAWAYVAFLPVVIAASYTQPFQDRYPFYDLLPGESLWPLMAWWVFYSLQFAALEWFFRGFMVHGMKPLIGYLAVPLMVVPYFLIHLQKPALEAVGAIVAGMALGTLALKTRTIWWGAALHIAVALTMDVASLQHKGLLL